MTQRSRTVRVEYEGRTRTGPVVDLRGTGLGPEAVRRAIRDWEGESDADSDADADNDTDALAADVHVDCPEPGPVSDQVGVVSPAASVAVRPALAAAARSRDVSAPQAEALADVRERLDALDPPAVDPDPAAARRRLAGTESTVERRRERVATLRGRVQTARETGGDVDALAAELADATRALSEAETERAAAEEALDRAERRARAARDARERRRRLADRLANLEREARAHLVDCVRDEYVTAVAGLCDRDDSFDVPDDPLAASGDSCDVPADVAALAVGRVAALRAPVVLACDRLAPAAAVEWLEAPVVRVRRDDRG